MIKKLTVGVMTLASVLSLSAGTVKLGWDSSTSPEVNRYKVYAVQGTNTVFTANNANASAVLTVTNQLTVTFSNLTAGAWTFTATALSTNNIESANCSNVWTNVPLAGVVNLTITSATVQ